MKQIFILLLVCCFALASARAQQGINVSAGCPILLVHSVNAHEMDSLNFGGFGDSLVLFSIANGALQTGGFIERAIVIIDSAFWYCDSINVGIPGLTGSLLDQSIIYRSDSISRASTDGIMFGLTSGELGTGLNPVTRWQELPFGKSVNLYWHGTPGLLRGKITIQILLIPSRFIGTSRPE